MVPFSKKLDRLVSSGNPWLVLLGCAITPPVVLGMALIPELTNPDSVMIATIRSFWLLILGAMVVGLCIGIVVVVYKKFAGSNHPDANYRAQEPSNKHYDPFE